MIKQNKEHLTISWKIVLVLFILMLIPPTVSRIKLNELKKQAARGSDVVESNSIMEGQNLTNMVTSLMEQAIPIVEIKVELNEPEETTTPQYPPLTRSMGVNYGPSGKETYYNLPMRGVIRLMKTLEGISEEYWIREDGVKMYGDYIMVAADTRRLPKGTILETSLGTAMVCDHCGSAESYSGIWLDIAVTW